MSATLAFAAERQVVGRTTRVIKVENSHFTLHLPDGWKERANVDGTEWVTPDGTQQMIVSVVLPKEGADLRQALDTLMTIRQEQVAKLGGAGRLLPTGIKAERDSWIGTMVGAEAVRRVLMFVRFVATPVRIVTAAVYQYGTLDDPKGFGARAEDICSTLAVSRERAKPGWRRFLPW